MMAKSADLYELCPICGGDGENEDSELNNDDGDCVVCLGEGISPIGLNRAQVDTAIFKAKERDNLNMRVVALEKLLTRWQRFNEIEEVVEHGDFIALYNDTCEALETGEGVDSEQ